MRTPRVKAVSLSNGKVPRWVSLALAGCFLLLGSLPLCGQQAAALDPEKPLWEFGLFNGVALLPHYRGSDQYNTYVLPIPYFMYRGERVQASREGLRGILFSSDRVETSFSFNGNPPVDGDNRARTGMDELDALLEAGPALKIYLQDKTPLERLYLRTAVRGVVSVGPGFDTGWRGFRGGFNLVYRRRHFLGVNELTVGVNAGIEFSSSAYNDYLYEVTEDDALPSRPVYSPGEGYGGYSVSGNLLKKLSDRFSVGIYGRWDNLEGTAFETSPLVRDKDSYVLGFALLWRIAASDTMVPIDPDF